MDDVVPTNVAISRFNGGSSNTKGILPLEITIGGKTSFTAFFIIDSTAAYNLLLGRDWIHPNMCITSTLHQMLIFWDGNEVKIVEANSKPFIAKVYSAKAALYDETVVPIKFVGQPLKKLKTFLMNHANKEEKKRQAFRADCIRLKTYLAEKRLAREEQLYEEVSASTADIVKEGLEKVDAIQLEDLESNPSRMEDNKAKVQVPLYEINVGTEEDHRPLFVSALLEPNFQANLIKLLKEYKDCFAWSYEEMPGLTRKLVEHRLPIKKDFQPYKQPPRRMSMEVMLKIKEEIERILKAGFIRTVRYVEWLSNVVPVIKKNGKLRICVDFRNLNTATLKDEYPMLVADQLIDSAAKHEIMSFMDCHSGCTQIYIAEEDIPQMAFRCPGSIGTFEWVVMPFGLKNARATYQRAMNSIFHDMIGRFMEVYIDDVVVKSSAKK
ncbi:uncharacterized protein LOC132277533 [Cornus florida]|uniref:uncharacterized protein LOC132277533 n=1 Tax=Cornus florida TaxID=4283 RepID=UPI00289B95EE|nr:uncharacterized protein LOC132277533 [Cornus florida]